MSNSPRNRKAHVCAAEPYLDILLAASCAVSKAADEAEQVLVPIQVKCQARVQDPDLVQRAQRIPVGEELRKAVGHANGMNGENCVVGSFGPVDREIADLDVLEDRGGNCRVADAPADLYSTAMVLPFSSAIRSVKRRSSSQAAKAVERNREIATRATEAYAKAFFNPASPGGSGILPFPPHTSCRPPGRRGQSRRAASTLASISI